MLRLKLHIKCFEKFLSFIFTCVFQTYFFDTACLGELPVLRPNLPDTASQYKPWKKNWRMKLEEIFSCSNDISKSKNVEQSSQIEKERYLRANDPEFNRRFRYAVLFYFSLLKKI